MWRRLLRGAEVWEDRQRTVLVTEASPGRWIRPVHEEDDLANPCVDPCVECELLEDRCVGWVHVRDLQLSAPEPETHALRASRRYRGHRGLLHVPSVVAFVEAHVARTREDRARYKRGGTTGPSLFDASGFVQAAFANASSPRPVFIPRRVHEQHHFAEPVDDLNEATPGDLVFFGVQPPNAFKGCVDVRHVGIITAVRCISGSSASCVELAFASVTDPIAGRGIVARDSVIVPSRSSTPGARGGNRSTTWEFGRARPGPEHEGDAASERLAQTVLSVGRCRRGVEGADDLPRGRTASSARCGGSSRCAVQISQGFDPNHGVSHLRWTGVDLTRFSWDTEVNPSGRSAPRKVFRSLGRKLG